MRVRWNTFWQLRKLAVETFNLAEEHTKAIKGIEYTLGNHVLHRLDEHDAKLDQILDRLPPKKE